MTRATTTAGEVRGREKDGALLFAGIPYAAPPVGTRRFRPPEPHEGWRGVRDATRFGPAAPQLPGEGLTSTPNVRWDEDCLTLNVCTPRIDDGRRPVLVWLHGGAFRTGQGGIPWYSGISFAHRGVVTVSLNYRLGGLGFASLGALGGSEFASSGMNGILDQVAALEWVRDNIAAFGGDPEQVTVAGESAGGMSVGVLLGCPAAHGLFRAAIPQSGAAHHVSSAEDAEQLGSQWAELLGADDVATLQSRPVTELLEAQAQVEKQSAALGDPNGGGGMPFRPVVDGRVLPKPPLEAIAGGSAAGVSVMIGTNLDETTLFGMPDLDDAALGRLIERHGVEPAAAIATYRANRPDAKPAELAIAVTTDHMFRIPAVRLAEAHAGAGGDAWMYLFSWRSRAYGGRLGATHALEIPFAWNNLDKPGVAPLLGEGPSPQPLADTMHAAWIAFAHHGDPNCDALPSWARYSPESRAVMELGERVGSLADPAADERALWEGVR
ncbi:MAG: carboxylesterase/lipase family protein [Myxococcales bacterium]|nr:carboxylesterase/lipase family protein [Myxococcales bacterium]